MARIRSVHPSIFTDESWVSCSPVARLLYIGLWTDADDQGLFEWKPLQLKMRLLPGDAADVASLLGELAAVDLIAPFEHGGRQFGAIKQFRKYQRPKKPNSIHFLPDEWRTYVCLDTSGSEAGDDDRATGANQLPTSSELSPQMEDGGGKVEDGTVDAIAPTVGERAVGHVFDELWKAYPHQKGRSSRPKSLAALKASDPVFWPRLPAAAARFKREGKLPPNGAAALERWLEDERWRDWMDNDDAMPAATWSGPPEVRAAFVKATSEDWAKAYIDKSKWQDVPDRALIPATSYAANKIITEGRAILRDLEISVLGKAA